MAAYFDTLETRDPEEREVELFAGLPDFLSRSMTRIDGVRAWLDGTDAGLVTDRAGLAKLPVLRKPELMRMQQDNPPFGGLADPDALRGNRVFMSPGPVWEPQGFGVDSWQSARSLFAAGFRAGDTVHNAFSYHMTPGAFILDEGARALGCLVFPAGVGNTEAQVEAAGALRPTAYTGTPDFLKILLDKAADTGADLSSITQALVSGGALFPSLREEYAARGVKVLQAYATADIGVIAYESADEEGNAHPGLILNENLIMEIVRPGTGDPVPDGEVGEIVVTSLNPAYPLVRFGTGDLSAVLPGLSPCGRTGVRIKGWMGRADQRTKIKGMFVDPKQVAAVVDRHPGIARARLVVARDGEQDSMTLHIETAADAAVDDNAVAATLADTTKLRGSVTRVATGSLPNDGKVISDEREYNT